MLRHKIVTPATWETEAGGGRVLGPRGLYSWTPPRHKGTLFAEIGVFYVPSLSCWYITELMTSRHPAEAMTTCHLSPSLLVPLRLSWCRTCLLSSTLRIVYLTCASPRTPAADLTAQKRKNAEVYDKSYSLHREFFFCASLGDLGTKYLWSTVLWSLVIWCLNPYQSKWFEELVAKNKHNQKRKPQLLT